MAATYYTLTKPGQAEKVIKKIALHLRRRPSRQ